VVIEGRFNKRDQHRWPFQLDETGDDESEFRVVRTDADNNVVGDVIFHLTDDGDVLLIVRRFDEAQFGSLNVVFV
jgi:hypothetical protein